LRGFLLYLPLISTISIIQCHVLHSSAEYFKGQCSAGFGDICESVEIVRQFSVEQQGLEVEGM